MMFMTSYLIEYYNSLVFFVKSNKNYNFYINNFCNIIYFSSQINFLKLFKNNKNKNLLNLENNFFNIIKLFFGNN
jgi:hypothetical protein